ncbi:MepB family protein [Flavobacterium sp.]|uniref:MepB family protein n=1 Tax=Flavobacterium sp. TaxID=239 RepID=UPI0025BF30E0|nr:MepB family protein [Flavobacterium sp.]
MTLKNSWTDLKVLPKDLIIAKELLYDCCNLDVTQPHPEAESSDYDAYRFQFNQKQICYRTAKITPTKTGQFVTLWKRNATGIIEPFDFSDSIDFVIVSVRKDGLFGQFVFPKTVLLEKGIFTTPTKEGKRATRVYPPWDETTSKQAQKTQQWQLNYFHAITPNTNLTTFKALF